MKPENTPPKVCGRLLGVMDTLFVLALIPLSAFVVFSLLPALKKEADFWPGFMFLSIIAIAMGLAGVAGLLALFARIEVSESGIKYRFMKWRMIDWDSITELRFIGMSVNMGFTQKVFIRTRDKKVHFIPLASDLLVGYFNGIGNYKETEPNQAPETTICTVTDRAPSSTLRASADRVSP